MRCFAGPSNPVCNHFTQERRVSENGHQRRPSALAEAHVLTELSENPQVTFLPVLCPHSQ